MAPSAKEKRPNNSTISANRRQSPAGLTGSVITSSGRRSARIAEKKKPMILRQIIVSDDVWLSIFPFLGRAKVGLKLALLSYRFDGLADTHFKTRKWALGEVEIRRSKNGAEIGKRKKKGGLEWFPIQQVPASKNLIAFNKITIRYIDDTVIDFLRRIQHLFNTGITLILNSEENQKRSRKVIAQHVWPLFKSNVNKMELNYGILSKLRTHISPTVLRDCANLRSIHPPVSIVPCGSGDDHRGASDGQALSKWLHTPRDDGRPKVLKYSYLFSFSTNPIAVVEALKQEFRNASASVNYIIVLVLYFEFGHQPFQLENEQTRERLEFEHVHHTSPFRLLKRGPIARDATKWAEWEREAMENWSIKKNVINLLISDKKIGPLSQAGPSSSK
uniref:Uncharacterized protein n=1 Tax=Globodera rostochiensis TaxID=31243 RepID=A0A914HCR9_GLORO